MGTIRKYFYWLGLFVCMALFLTGCGTGGNGEVSPASAYTITDYTGRKVEFAKPPQRVYVRDHFAETIIYGLTPERLIATTRSARNDQLSLFAKEAKQFKYVTEDLSLETILALRPEVVILRNGSRREEADTFMEAGIPVVVVDIPRSGEEVENLIVFLAKLLGVPERGELMLDRIHAQLAEVDEGLKNIKEPYPRVFFVMFMNLNYGGKGCMLDFLCEKAKTVNAIAAMGVHNGEFITRETMVESNPDFFIVPQTTSLSYPATRKEMEDFKSDPSIFHLDAFRNGRVKPILMRYTFATNQQYVWAIKGIANVVHGPIFDMSREHLITGLPDGIK